MPKSKNNKSNNSSTETGDEMYPGRAGKCFF